jgi:hypothetical protein
VISKNVYNTTAFRVEYYAQKMWFNIASGSDRIGAISPSTINDDTWRHYACTFDRDGDATLYTNGASSATKDISAQSARDLTANKTIALGTYSDDPTNSAFWFPGAVSDVKIYIGGLWTPTQIAYQSANELDVSASAGTITEFWGCQEGTGTTITAGVTAPTNNLTLTNALAWASTTTIKKFGGVAQASIKKVGSVAVAAIKKLGGVA